MHCLPAQYFLPFPNCVTASPGAFLEQPRLKRILGMAHPEIKMPHGPSDNAGAMRQVLILWPFRPSTRCMVAAWFGLTSANADVEGRLAAARLARRTP